MLMDIYVLAPERTVAMIERFLARFLPNRERTAKDFPVPEFSDAPVAVFDTPEEVIHYCCAHPNAQQRVYWRNRSTRDPHSAHVFFLPAGGLVLGLSVATRDVTAWDRWLEELRSFNGATHGYWTCECPPENTVAEFIAAAS